MPITEVFVSFAYATQMIIAILFALDYKRGKKGVPLLVFASVADFLLVNYFSLSKSTWIIAFFCEAIFFLLIIGYFCAGNIWRNYIIIWINFQIANILISLEYYVINRFVDLNTSVLFFGTQGVFHAILDWILMAFDALVALYLSRKLFKREYNGQEIIYKFMVIFLIIGTFVVSFKRITTIWDMTDSTGQVDPLKRNLVFMITVVGMVMALLVIGYLYNLFELRRLSKEKKMLQDILEKNHKRYMIVLENNKGLKEFRDMLSGGAVQLTEKLSTASVSGNVLLDTVVLTHVSNFEKQGIAFERIIPPMKEDLAKDKKLATIVDLLLKISELENKRNSKEKWIYLVIKKIGENTIVKLEASKSKRKLRYAYELKLLKKIIYSTDGTIDIKDNEEEFEISVLV